MIITKTPFRLSLMGGGTDLRAFYRHGGGAVVSTAIDKFVYLAIHRYFEPKIVLKYSRTEVVDDVREIVHPLIRECMLACEVNEPLELTSFADIPSSGSGLGSSSAFAVGLVKVLHAFKGREASSERCAAMACDVEIARLIAPIGKQDQYASAYGGLNFIRFCPDESVLVEPIVMPSDRRTALQKRLMMFFTGVTRQANSVLAEQQRNTEEDSGARDRLTRMLALAESLRGDLVSGTIDTLGPMLHEAWCLKKGLASGVSSSAIDAIYDAGRRAGATGGKVLGAGGGGFIVFDVPEEKQASVAEALADLRRVPIAFEPHGTRTLYYQDEGALP